MRTATLIHSAMTARRIVLRGRVQGLGVRPAVARAAHRLDLFGMVRNVRAGLEIEIEGSPDAVDRFVAELDVMLPSGAAYGLEQIAEIPPSGRQAFRIEPSLADGQAIGVVPVDRAICAECLAEVRDPRNRRFGYAFTSCAACGPRYAILERMPYDRATTSMRDFPRCAVCEREYRDPGDRRFHAETICCAHCGPRPWATDGESRRADDAAIDWVAEVVRHGGIAAIKGIGGYQLLVDATRPPAVRRLRRRKRRPAKPLAVMVASFAEAEGVASLSDTERYWLSTAENPIVVARRSGRCALANEVALDCGDIGLLLPSSALHALLLERIGRPVVCTSGNVEGEPLAYTELAAEQRLRGIADIWLHHDRRIVRPIDDSVVRVVAGDLCVIRAARGLAPYGLDGNDGHPGEPIVAFGGELKSATALWTGRDAVLAPYVGDLSDAETCQRWVESYAALRQLYDVSPTTIARDRHPDYFTSRVAEKCSAPSLAVQHHHAHAAAVLWEHRRCDESAVALVWDGAGYGDDGASWGGECLLASLADYQRVAHLLPFSLPGGDAAVREPWRVAVSLAALAGVRPESLRNLWPNVLEARIGQVWYLASRIGLSPQTTSMGRLFDGVAAIAFQASTAGFEGQLAMRLETAYEPTAPGYYSIDWRPDEGVMDWRSLIREVVDDKLRGVSPGAISARFHRALADLIACVSEHYSLLPLVTSGGVFQNAVLGELVADRVGDRPRGWLRPRRVPPGDGGLALGQLAVALARRRMASNPLEGEPTCA